MINLDSNLMELKEIDDRRDRAVGYFMEGYNCAQSVVLAYCDVIGIDQDTAKKISAPFGGGMGRLREMCGACSGMFMLMGFKYPVTDANNQAIKEENYTAVQRTANEFKDYFGSYICADLLKLDRIPQHPFPSNRNARYYAERPCSRFVAVAAEIVGRELLTEAHHSLVP